MPQLKRVACLQEAGIPLMIHAGYPSDANGRDDATMGENIAVCAFLIAAQEYSYVAVGQGWNGPSSFPALPLLKKPLGPPKADARVVDAAAGVYTRQFEHLDLSLNVSAWACDWRWH